MQPSYPGIPILGRDRWQSDGRAASAFCFPPTAGLRCLDSRVSIHLFIAESGVVSLLVSAFTIWMLIECLRKDPDRYLWMWLILIMPGIGPVIYFFVRWLPGRQLTAAWLATQADPRIGDSQTRIGCASNR